jgi:hypothetical protein
MLAAASPRPCAQNALATSRRFAGRRGPSPARGHARASEGHVRTSLGCGRIKLPHLFRVVSIRQITGSSAPTWGNAHERNAGGAAGACVHPDDDTCLVARSERPPSRFASRPVTARAERTTRASNTASERRTLRSLSRSSASNLAAAHTQPCADIFVRDPRHAAATVCAPPSVGITRQRGQRRSIAPAISADRGPVRSSRSRAASNLAWATLNQTWDIFMARHGHAGDAGAQRERLRRAGNADILSASISADGRYVAFFSLCNNLVYGDHNGFRRRCSTAIPGFRVPGPRDPEQRRRRRQRRSEYPAISHDGHYIAFQSSRATSCRTTTRLMDIFVHDILNRLDGPRQPR